jgi:threonine synthase
MEFVSTRGHTAKYGFIDTFLLGLAEDGGLMLPVSLPKLTQDQLNRWAKLGFEDLMFEIFALFADGEIPESDLRELIRQSYAGFRSPDVTPLVKIDETLQILELFHGPTFAFKDVALQFIGNFYAYVSQQRGEIIHILGATSGDTGAAAIEGVRGKEGIRICILHPHEKVSKVQELQMTTVDDANVLNLAVQGTFDDCQRIIKDLFADVAFKNKYHLRAINSINFVRILAQTVYYFYAYYRVQEQSPRAQVSFSVATGNFGNILSGYLAKRMGLPIGRLILATNENNILERFVKEGIYMPDAFRSTYSPSMDIQVASNFERYLYYIVGENPDVVAAMMQQFRAEGKLIFEGELLKQVQADFQAQGVSNEACLHTVEACYRGSEYLLDPHTACGVAAYEAYRNPAAPDEVFVVLATAHPAKFDESIQRTGIEQPFPEEIAQLFGRPQHQQVVENANEEVARRLEQFFIAH